MNPTPGDLDSEYTLVISELTYDEKEAIKAYLRQTYPNLNEQTAESNNDQSRHTRNN